MNGVRAKLDYILKHNQIVNKVFRGVASFGVRTMGLFIPVDEKAILFSGHTRKYNDSPRAIYEYMIKDPRFSEYTFYWALDNPNEIDIPGKCIKIIPDTPTYFKTALKCKYWITCVNIERSLKFKRKENIYLNTWHGIPIKTVGNLASGRKDYDFSYIDYFCISGDYDNNVYKKAFNISEKQYIKTGLPRNDILYHTNEEEKLEIKNKLGLPKDKKVILYAPTWRDSKDGGNSYEIKPPIDFSLWEKDLSEDYVLLLRTHPYTTKLLDVEFNDFIRDYISYPNINDLLKITDILISDYSATIFDFSILERPIICFAYDIKDYNDQRGLLMNLYEELPSEIYEKQEDVLSHIKTLDYRKESEKTVQFKNKYIMYGGNACEECVKALFK